MATSLLNFKHRSPRVLLTPLRLPSVSTLHLPCVSWKQLFSNTKVTISSLHLGSPNSKSKPISNLARTTKSFRLSNRINRRFFSKRSTCNAWRCLTCHHISCESTVTSSINGGRCGIGLDRDVDCDSSGLVWFITWEARGSGAQYVGEASQGLRGRFRSRSYKVGNTSRRRYRDFLCGHFIECNHSIGHVEITPVEILSKLSGESKNDMKERGRSAELNWIKRLQTPYPLGLNDQICRQGSMSSIRSGINIFSFGPEVRGERRSRGVRRDGLSGGGRD